MTKYWAVMLDECGQEFGAGVTAGSKTEAHDILMEDYPENRGIVQLESPEDTANRIAETQRRAMREYDDYYEDY